ncbi:MAG: 16S rRNA (guanine(966)-N(2))-methyltransferase RsmD [Acidimicrobiia bacterium]|nr:16S rRNA (guanine(966)-N(2))-methyltransferase RsmD [Acidimicrobiia bacterium]NND13312.1 16S rRNA (guanine(966)-N(2))-methyltransferase RsmD [Acidimicrobiia bacterium]
MRVIAGKVGGRKLSAPPPSTTRPFTGKAKEGVFSSIADRIEGARVLDLYAGSGSLGIEALSRGASEATMVEESREAVKVISANLAACGFDASVIRGTLPAAMSRVTGLHDLVFVDPPYRLSLASVQDVVEHLGPYLADGATVIVHRRKGDGLIQAGEGLEVEDVRTYGDSEIVRLRKRGNP